MLTVTCSLQSVLIIWHVIKLFDSKPIPWTYSLLITWSGIHIHLSLPYIYIYICYFSKFQQKSHISHIWGTRIESNNSKSQKKKHPETWYQVGSPTSEVEEIPRSLLGNMSLIPLIIFKVESNVETGHANHCLRAKFTGKFRFLGDFFPKKSNSSWFWGCPPRMVHPIRICIGITSWLVQPGEFGDGL